MNTVMTIHPTAIIHPTAQIADGVIIGPYAVIGENVVLHPRVRIGPHAVVEFADVGEACQIHAGSFIGTAPQDLKYRGERTRVSLGPGCVIRECVTLNRGTAATALTQIGARCLFMAYSHVAHDCIIGSEVIVANSVAIAGHCDVGDGAIIGGMAGIHQFVRIGKLAMIGAGAMVPLDIAPFTMAQGDRAKLHGLNLIGLKRRGYSTEAIADLKKAYRELFDATIPLKEQIEHMMKQERTPAVRDLLSFLQASTRGICRPASKKNAVEED
ncbi:MAG: acyl-ACP--UDP-N-acetylglucosamine O-acyltransferase [Elusimicrobiota bacterium]|jgi:UDP-N-acetylglucosamine acyltransferase